MKFLDLELSFFLIELYVPVSSVNPSCLSLQLSSKQSSNPSSHPKKAFFGATTNKLFTFVFLLFLNNKVSKI